MKTEELTGSILKYAKALDPDATVIVYVSSAVEGVDDFASGVDMFNADHYDVADVLALLAQWLADDVEQAREDST